MVTIDNDNALYRSKTGRKMDFDCIHHKEAINA
jgi:hypothetical protein